MASDLIDLDFSLSDFLGLTRRFAHDTLHQADVQLHTTTSPPRH